MSYILIPQFVTDTTALIWIGVIDENVRTATVFVEHNVTGKPDEGMGVRELAQSEWRTWKTRNPLEKSDGTSDMNTLHYQRIRIGLDVPLRPRTQYTIRVRIVSKEAGIGEEAKFQDYSGTADVDPTRAVDPEDHLTKATVTTLPTRIPPKDQKAFTVMLGSCFYLPTDPKGMVGHTFLKLPEDAQPDIKFLCGDQVYLDNPWKAPELFKPFMTKDRFRKFFFQKYLQTWTQVRKEPIADANGVVKDKIVGGFNPLLRNGANYFCSDDHEFWNNAPNVGGVGLAQTLLLSQRRWWFREASELFRIFQSLAPWMTFEVPPISFCIADTRINRTRHNIVKEDHEAQFMEEHDLEAIGAWIENLTGPGILVLGQLVMAEKASKLKSLFTSNGKSFFSRVGDLFSDYADFALPDFPRQYTRLCEFIKNSRHSIVLLTGDVHFGRLTECELDEKKGIKFVEIVSSPMSVVAVSEKVMGFGTYGEAPSIFELKKMQSVSIAQSNDPERKPAAENHFVTIEFQSVAENTPEVEMKVRAWKIVKPGNDLGEGETVEPIEVKTISLR